MTLVWRVEDDAGMGPYKARVRHPRDGASIGCHHEGWEHPSPWSDTLQGGERAPDWSQSDHLCVEADEVCALESLPRLRRWFDGWGAVLHRAGHHVAVYDVPREQVRYGLRQCVFTRGDLEPVRVLTMRQAWREARS